MEHFYLEEPSINRKEDVIAYMQEHVNYNSFINGSGGFDHILEGKTFEDCLEKSINMQSKDYAYGNGMVPGKEFFLIREEDNKLVGMINIRYDLTPNMLEFGGHIGYGIRPTERRKGYNKINLYLLHSIWISKKSSYFSLALNSHYLNLAQYTWFDLI